MHRHTEVILGAGYIPQYQVNLPVADVDALFVDFHAQRGEVLLVKDMINELPDQAGFTHPP